MPAAQYFATRGFFPDYNARLDEPLTEAVRRVWGEGLTALREGRLDAMTFAKQVSQAEADDSPKLERTRGEAMLSMWRAVSGVHRRAAFIKEPRIFIRHGERRRRFIGPHAIELPNGDLLMSAPWGRPPADIAEEIVANHPVPDLYRSTDRGRTWTNAGPLPVKWKHRGFVSDGGVSFLRLADGRLALLLHRHIRGFKGGGLPAICFSSDDGQTWTDPMLLAGPEDEGVWYVMNNRLVQTRGGRLLVPVARAVGKFEGDRDESLVFYSDDAGKTWQRSEPAPLPDGPRGMAEPCVIELKDGRLLMIARGGLGVLLASHSEDGGRTWSRGIAHHAHFAAQFLHAAPAAGRTPHRFLQPRRAQRTRRRVSSLPARLRRVRRRGHDLEHALHHRRRGPEARLRRTARHGPRLSRHHLPQGRHARALLLPHDPQPLRCPQWRRPVDTRATRPHGRQDRTARLSARHALVSACSRKPAGIVLDDDAAEYTGAWKVGEKLTPLVGFSYRHDDPATKSGAVAKFTPEIPADGKYEVRLLYIHAANRAQKVAITIRSAEGEKVVTQNQRVACLENGIPRSLGVFAFAKGKSGSIEISNAGADGYVIIDGLQLVPEDIARTERATRTERRVSAQDRRCDRAGGDSAADASEDGCQAGGSERQVV